MWTGRPLSAWDEREVDLEHYLPSSHTYFFPDNLIKARNRQSNRSGNRRINSGGLFISEPHQRKDMRCYRFSRVGKLEV